MGLKDRLLGRTPEFIIGTAPESKQSTRKYHHMDIPSPTPKTKADSKVDTKADTKANNPFDDSKAIPPTPIGALQDARQDFKGKGVATTSQYPTPPRPEAITETNKRHQAPMSFEGYFIADPQRGFSQPNRNDRRIRLILDGVGEDGQLKFRGEASNETTWRELLQASAEGTSEQEAALSANGSA